MNLVLAFAPNIVTPLQSSILVGIGFSLMVLGILLFFVGIFKTPTKETNDKLRKDRKKYRERYSISVNIPNVLLHLHEHILSEVSKQQKPKEKAASISADLIKVTDLLSILLMSPLFVIPKPFKKMFAKTRKPAVSTVICNWNAKLEKYNLGTLVVTKSKPYQTLLEKITNYKDGLPTKTTLKIDQYIVESETSSFLMLCEQLFCGDEMPSLIKWRFSLILPSIPKKIDRHMTKLRSDISEEIERFLLGE